MSEKGTEFLKECIADAILELLREKPLDKITADDICKRSGVGRATYFRHFKSKEDAIVFKRRLLWQRYCARVGIEAYDRFHLESGLELVNFVYEIREMTLLLYSTGNKYILTEYFRTLAENENFNLEERYRQKFLLFGLFGILDTWAQCGFDDPPEKILDRFYNIIATLDT